MVAPFVEIGRRSRFKRKASRGLPAIVKMVAHSHRGGPCWSVKHVRRKTGSHMSEGRQFSPLRLPSRPKFRPMSDCPSPAQCCSPLYERIAEYRDLGQRVTDEQTLDGIARPIAD
jgi:hypothetical protein